MTHNEAPTVYLPCGFNECLHWSRRLIDRCQWCNAKFIETSRWRKSSRDHLIPQSRGGPNKISNIIIACVRCNNGRANTDHCPWWQFYGPKWESLHTLKPDTVFGFDTTTIRRAKHGDCSLWTLTDEWSQAYYGNITEAISEKPILEWLSGNHAGSIIVPAGVVLATKKGLQNARKESINK